VIRFVASMSLAVLRLGFAGLRIAALPFRIGRRLLFRRRFGRIRR
jgi:hypothetical protein